MKDSIEEYIEQHRDEFDVHVPRAKVWDSIEAGMSRGRKRRYAAFAAAASVLVLVGALYLFYRYTSSRYREPAATASAGTAEINEAEMYYAALVREKQAAINQYRNEFPDLLSDFANDMNTLCADYKALKTEYTSTVRQDIVKQAMIENLQAQVSMADMQLDIMEKVKRKENNKI